MRVPALQIPTRIDQTLLQMKVTCIESLCNKFKNHMIRISLSTIKISKGNIEELKIAEIKIL